MVEDGGQVPEPEAEEAEIYKCPTRSLPPNSPARIPFRPSKESIGKLKDRLIGDSHVEETGNYMPDAFSRYPTSSTDPGHVGLWNGEGWGSLQGTSGLKDYKEDDRGVG